VIDHCGKQLVLHLAISVGITSGLHQSSIRTELAGRAPSVGEDEKRSDVVGSWSVDRGMSSAIML